jgi:glutamate N-acetyltransferase / amino-acid N-acetyltransferase
VPHLAPTGLLEVPGFRAMGMKCGIKKDRPDLMMLVSDQEGTTGAAMFTQNAFAAAPVHISRQHVANGDVRAVVCNSGNANACTGRQGLRNALRMARETADLLGLEPEQVLVCSTGIIGREMPMDLISAGIKNGIKNLSAGGIGEAARAILTTDSGPKEATATFTHDGIEYHLAGFAKGAGMIHPNLATMLAFVLTDAPVPADDLRAALKHAVDHTFNQISVDGDESTNDTVIVLANGAAGGTRPCKTHSRASASAWPAGLPPTAKAPSGCSRCKWRAPRPRKRPAWRRAPWCAATSSRAPCTARTPTGAACSPPSAAPVSPSRATR